MTQLQVKPRTGAASFRLTVPGDKSISHRALLLGALAEGPTTIHGILRGEDVHATAQALQRMGVALDWDAEPVTVQGVGRRGLREPGCPLDMGNAGTGMRLLMGVIAGQDFSAVLTGDDSLRKRPMDRIAHPLNEMGAFVETSGSRSTPPVNVHGAELRPLAYDSPLASAQVKSAVLLAGLNAPGTTVVREPGPSRDHTERMLRAFGAQLTVAGREVRLVGQPHLLGQEIHVPGDPSSAAFLLAAACLWPGLEVAVENVMLNPTRTGFFEALREMGANLEYGDERHLTGEPVGTVTARYAPLEAREFGGEIIPRMIDELPLLALAATQATGTTSLHDAQELRVKESDRLATTEETLDAMGADISASADGLTVTGPSVLHGAAVDAHGDHRIAMLAAIAGLGAVGQTTINGASCIATSFPGFAAALRQMGAEVREQ